MKIQVTQQDIEKGRAKASSKCGCPIWQAVRRQLGISEDEATRLIILKDYFDMAIGKTHFSLPAEAVSMQRILVECPHACVAPLEFFAPVSGFSRKERSAR